MDTRPNTSDPLWNFAFDRIKDVHEDIRYVKADMGDLRNTVNDHLEKFQAKLEIQDEKIEAKADKEDLFRPFSKRFLNSWRKRFLALGATATGVFTVAAAIYQVAQRFV